MLDLGKPKLCTKFEVASFSHCVYIEGEPAHFGELPSPDLRPLFYLDVTLPKSIKNTVYVTMTQIFLHVLCQDFNLVDTLYMRGSAALRFPTWMISKTECTPAGRILTPSTNLLIPGVTNWRLWFDWIVDTLNSCFGYLVHLLHCSVT